MYEKYIAKGQNNGPNRLASPKKSPASFLRKGRSSNDTSASMKTLGQGSDESMLEQQY